MGVDAGKKQLVLGIIDYLRQYTWDKQLETYVKSSGVLGYGTKQVMTIHLHFGYEEYAILSSAEPMAPLCA